MDVVYIRYKNIDKLKWDACIKNASNGLIYAQSFYLDNMAANWDALVLNDYEAVMPLTWKKKWGIRYLYQPAFTQQGGIYFKEKISKEVMQCFVSKALAKFRFVEIALNFYNTIDQFDRNLHVTQRNNFILALDRPYEKLYENYHLSFTKNLKRTKKFKLLYSATDNYTILIELYKSLYGSRLRTLTVADFYRFTIICNKLYSQNNLVVRHVHSAENLLLASVILLKDEKRLYNIMSCVTPEGRKLEASYFLFDRIIHEFAGTNCLLDFEGSDIEGIAKFYNSFNPISQPYPFIKYNNLHPIIKLFKQ